MTSGDSSGDTSEFGLVSRKPAKAEISRKPAKPEKFSRVVATMLLDSDISEDVDETASDSETTSWVDKSRASSARKASNAEKQERRKEHARRVAEQQRHIDGLKKQKEEAKSKTRVRGSKRTPPPTPRPADKNSQGSQSPNVAGWNNSQTY